MFNFNEYSIFVYRDNIDFRKSINGLHAIVRHQMHMDPCKKSIFLFRNRSRDKIKIFYWDRTGFALWYKVLAKDKFPWPLDHEDHTVAITHDQLAWLLNGIDYWSLKPHKQIVYDKVS